MSQPGQQSGAQAGAQPPGFVGYVVEVTSYTELRAHVYAASTRLLRYGALAHVADYSSGKEYLALVVDVSEKNPVPLVNQQAVQQLYQNLIQQGATLQQIQQVMQQLLSPSQGLIKWHSVRELKLRILGQITSGQSGPELVLPEEPPRPLSVVSDPPQQLLQSLLSRGLGQGGIVLGELAYNPGIDVAVNPVELTKHLAVLGQTGSGKSETVKRLVAEYAWRKHHIGRGGGIIVFDVSGEYSGITYRPGGQAVPLLDAVLDPASFTNLQPQWLRNAPKTILVPYDLSTLSLHAAAEQRYAAEIGLVVEQLRQRYPHVQVVGLLYARHHIYRIDGSQAIQNITRDQAAALLQSNDVLLVVAAPLPDSLSLSELVALSPTKSEYYELAVSEVAERLGLLSVEQVVSVSALAQLLETAWRLNQRARSQRQQQAQQQQPPADKLASAVQQIINDINNGVAPDQAIRNHIGNLLGTSFVPVRPWLNLLALPLIASDPATALNSPSVTKALQIHYPVPNMTWANYLRRYLASALNEYLGYAPQTVASTARSMKKLEKMVSPFLDASQYRLLAERLYGGFSIVHIAHPSRGDVAPHVARLLNEVFAVASTGSQGGRYTLLVVEEAHNLAPADEDTASKKALLRIAREGRKWGLSLVLVSQRPGFIDPGILSQASSLIALRITNPDDLTSIRRSVESVTQDAVDRLPDLDPGQAIVSGPMVPERKIPLLVRVKMVTPLLGGQASQSGGQAPGAPSSPAPQPGTGGSGGSQGGAP